VNLEALGWGPFFAGAFAAFAADGLRPARVAGEDKLHYTAVGEDGPVTAVISGRVHHRRADNAALPKVGDWVGLSRSPGEGRAVIQAVLPRRTTLARKAAGRETKEQILATNIDTVFVVQALDATLNSRRLERFLIMVHEGGARPVILLNKADLAEHLDEAVRQAEAVAGGAPVLTVSARTRKGLGHLRELTPAGTTVAFIGASGAGKSSLINRLLGEATQPTLEVRADDAKGRHSTTWREMIPLPGGGLVIDTPGMREFHLWLADEGVDQAFPDIAAAGGGCQFRDCRHKTEPGCAVKTAVAEGRISEDRYRHFLKLRVEIEETTQAKKLKRYAANRRRERSGTKAWLIENPPDAH
jgi:ribosome biogenesis GTPase / thiamine phosphate phosphatase